MTRNEREGGGPMDIQKQIAYWRDGAEEEMELAEELLQKGRFRHALFFAELAVEKMLKAHVARQVGGVPPKTHNLLRLAELGELNPTGAQSAFLARFQEYCLEGRYPEFRRLLPSREEADTGFRECREIPTWLRNLFN
ncbi:MAG: HEPN domain-containing protein [Candidatus Sumerlaeota bacterium]|nr:HEPN domain-containing protein [Candidatus Sumerlaeota bacterium]